MPKSYSMGGRAPAAGAGDGVVLADGTVEAAGTHERLLEEGGRYAELFEL